MMDVSETSAVALMTRLLERESGLWQPHRLFDLLSYVLDGRAQVGDASHYLFEYARRAGYGLPPYPLAECGEIRQFFADEGVRTIPEWYERKLGVSSQLYAQLPAHTLVVVRDIENNRKAFVLDSVYHRHDVGFATLAKSGLGNALAPDKLNELFSELMAFLLEEEPANTRENASVIRFVSRVF